MIFIKLILGSLFNNCYILSGNGADAVLIDPSGNYAKIKEKLVDKELRAKYVLLTHAHFDHYGAAGQLQKDGAEIYLHESDEGLIGGNYGYSRAAGFTLDHKLSDGQELDLAGLEINVIHTPGHTAGSVSFLVKDMLFTGDTLFCGDTGRTDLPSGSFEQLKHSIRQKLYTLPPDTKVFPGHEEETTIGAERISNSVIKAL